MASGYLVETDSSARRAAVSSAAWLAIAVTFGLLVQAALLWPRSFGDILSYGRLRAVHDTLVVFAWLSLAAFAVIYAIVPRVAGVVLHNERLGRLTLTVWNLVLFAAIGVLLFGMNQGRPLAELPAGIDALLALLLVLSAYNVGATLVRRRERTMYVSAWYMLAAATFVPLVFIAGNLTISSGVPDAILNGFYVQGLQWLWFAPVGIGAVYFVVPTATGNPLHSRPLASVGFWSLVAAGGWTGARGMVWGPAQDWLETIAIVMSAVLLIPVLSAMSNLFATARGRWGMVADDFGLRFAAAGLGLLAGWAALGAISAYRPMARLIGLTAWEAGLRHLALYGAFASLAFAGLYHMYPRVMGRAWYSRRMCSFHFWTTVGGALAGTAALFGQGLVQGSASLAWGTAGDASRLRDLFAFTVSSGRGWQAAGAVAYALLAVGQYVFCWNAYRTTSRGDPVYLVQTVPAQAVPA